MKISKRVLSLLLLLVFVVANIVTAPVFASNFSDVADTEKYASAVNFLNSRGVINGYEDGTFRPLNNVTRAEFTAMLMRYRGYGEVGDLSVENPPFPDVVTSDVSWAIGNIRTAQALGIVNGYEDGTFRPNNDVLFEEAVKMIVCAIGYQNYSFEGSEWYSKYITTATKKGILKNADGGIGIPATRSCIAQLLYNCNDVEAVDSTGSVINGSSVLDNDLNLTEATGIIYSNGTTSLKSPDVDDLYDDEIIIYNASDDTSDKYYVSNSSKYQDMLGYKIKYYYEYDREAERNVISTIDVMSNTDITIDAADIEDSESSASTIVYYPDGQNKSKKASISSDSIVVYNGKLYGSKASKSTFADYYAKESLPILGSIRLVDNNGDDAYDVVFVDSYEVYVVTSVSGSPNYTVTDTLTRVSNNTITLNPDNDSNIIFTDKNGSSLKFSSISNGKVLCIKKSSDSNGGNVLTTVVICGDSVTGQITGTTSGKSVKINSTTYDFSYAAPWMRDDSEVTMAQPAKGDSAVYYLDLNGDIVAYKKSETASNQQYAYLIAASIESESIDSTLQLKLFTQKNGLKTYACDDNTKVDGDDTLTAEELLEYLKTAEDIQGQNVEATTKETGVSQLIKFTTKTKDGETIIDEIITAKDHGDISEVKSDVLHMSSAFKAADKTSRYTSNKLTSNSGNGKSANIGSSFVITVPNDRTSEKGYKTVSLSSDLDKDTDYRAEVYDLTTAGTAKVVVFYDLASEIGAVKGNTSTFVVTEIETEEYGGKARYKITGYEGSSKSTTEKWCSTETKSAFDQVKVGDVIRLGKDSDGYATLDTIDILFGMDVDRNDVIDAYVSGTSLEGQGEEGSERYFLKKSISGDIYNAVWGYVFACDGDNLAIHDMKFDDKDSVDDTARHDYSVSNMSSTLFLRYDTSGKSLEIVNLNNTDGFDKADILKSLSQLADRNEPAEIFVFAKNSIPSLIIIK